MTDKPTYEELEQRVKELEKKTESFLEEHVKETLKESTRLNELLLDSLPHPAMLINKKRIVLAANKIAKDAGVEIGRLCWDTFGHRQCLSEEYKQRLKDNPNCQENDILCTFCLANELLQTNTTQNDPEVSAFGKLWDTWWVPVEEDIYLHYAIDITERKQAEEEHLNRIKLQAVIETAGAACHELNQPLQTISGYSELLSMGISEKSPLYGKVGKIKEQIDRMGEITAKLMGITRYETKVYSGEKNIVDLDNVRERRKYKRFIPSIRTFVIPQTDSPKEHQIIDISMGGLAFWYYEIQNQLDEFDELSINMTDGNFNLDNIHCKTISGLAIADDSPSGSVSMKRCGVQFGDLNQNQTDQLEYFIKNHTITI
jgi:hypothetical protein